jgi:hypothetical protein
MAVDPNSVAERAKRRAEALRANLRRRKEWQREQRQEDKKPSGGAAPSNAEAKD